MHSSAKRKCTEPTVPENAKRHNGTALATRGAKESDDGFEVSVHMSDVFMVYPNKLLDEVQSRHERLIKAIMRKVEKGSVLRPPFTYTITRKSISDPRSPDMDYNTTRPKVYSALSFANKQALKDFIAKAPAKKKFIELPMPADVQPKANPEFAGMQSVGHGCMGWGFDCWGCISLHLTTLKDGKLKHESIYVERKSVRDYEVQEVQDIQIMEHSNAAST